MKKILLLLTCIVLLIQCQKKEAITSNSTQTNTIQTKATTESVDEIHIQWIKKQYAAINSKKIQPQSFKFTCDVENTINYYIENGKIIKISIQWGYLGDGESYTEYYYDNENVFFIYNRYVGGPAGHKPETYEERSYIKNKQIIRFMENQEIVPCEVDCIINEKSQPTQVLQAFADKQFRKRLCDL